VRITAEELEVGMGKIAQPLRVALTGTAISPSIDKTLWLIGRERSLVRIQRALEYVLARAAAI
jgi:glutamyl-tRNA synthetase